VSLAIFDVDDIERTRVSFSVSNDTDTSLVSTTSDHGDVTDFEVDVSSNSLSGKIEFDSVTNLNVRVGVTDGTTVVGDDVRDSSGRSLSGLGSEDRVASSVGLRSFSELFDLEELEVGFGIRDSVEGETSLGVV